MNQGKLRIKYDDATDVLYLSIGEPRPAITNEDADDDTFLIRTDPKTGQTVGVTIIDYYGRFRRLGDLSWLRSKHLPDELVTYLEKRPEV